MYVRSVPSTKSNLDLQSLHVFRLCLICCLDNLYLITVIFFNFRQVELFPSNNEHCPSMVKYKVVISTIIVKLIK